MSFLKRYARIGPPIENLKNLKFSDKIALENCLSVSKSISFLRQVSSDTFLYVFRVSWRFNKIYLK